MIIFAPAFSVGCLLSGYSREFLNLYKRVSNNQITLLLVLLWVLWDSLINLSVILFLCTYTFLTDVQIINYKINQSVLFGGLSRSYINHTMSFFLGGIATGPRMKIYQFDSQHLSPMF